MTTHGHSSNDHRHRRRGRTKGVRPVYLSRGQRIWLARRLRIGLETVRRLERSPDAPAHALAVAVEEIRMIRSVLGRLREARADG